MNANLFTPQEKAQFALVIATLQRAARWNPLLVVWLGFLGAIQVFVGYVEWEIAYQIFAFVAGSGGYWSPSVMACTGLLMIIGFHVLAHHKPNNMGVRSVGIIAAILIPIYAIGLGLLVMAILFTDGLADLLLSEGGFTLGEVVETVDTDWLNWFFEHISNPIAVTVFAFAAGGLVIVNLFISHHLISTITSGIATVYERRTRYQDAKRDYAEIMECEKRYLEISHARGALASVTPADMGAEIAAEVIVTINKALAPHKQVLKSSEYSSDKSRFELLDPELPDPKQLKNDIQKIEAIQVRDILKALELA